MKLRVREYATTSTGLVYEVHDVRIILVLRDVSRIAHDVLQQDSVERMQQCAKHVINM